MNTRVGKQEVVLKASIDAFNEYGSHFSTRDVAEIADCSQALLYRYYPNKRDLVNATFTFICTDIRNRLREVEFPPEINCDTVQEYFVKVWRKYFDYLTDDDKRSNSNFYFYCLLNGYRYPAGYETTMKVIKKLIGDNFDALIEKCPNSIMVATYLMDISNGIAIGIFRGDFDDIDDYLDKLVKMVYNGIESMKSK